MFDFIFGKRKTTQELLVEYKLIISKTKIELNMEMIKISNEEFDLTKNLKKMAEIGDITRAKHLARSIILKKKYQTNFCNMIMELDSLEMKLTSMSTIEQMGKIVQKTNGVMRSITSTLNNDNLNKIMDEFNKRCDHLNTTENNFSKAFDHVISKETNEVDEKLLMDEILSEVGLNFKSELGEINISDHKEIEELEKRFLDLKK